MALPATSAGNATTAPPQAVRSSRPGWRDPRLWLGIAIIAACIVAGVRILGSADETVAVWAVRSDAGAGAVLTPDDLEAHRVRFASADDLAGYLRADQPLPDTLSLARSVGAGELVPRAALAVDTSTDTVQLPLAVDPAQVPPAVRSGSVVDVYVLGTNAARPAAGQAGQAGATGTAAASGGPGAAMPALSAVAVVAAPGGDTVFGSGQTQRQLTLAVPEKEAQAFFALLGSVADPTLTVVLRPVG